MIISVFFFFKQKTAYEMRISDWSSDVCSSDLEIAARRVGAVPVEADDRDYATDVNALLAAVTGKTRVVYLANPNNPTGTLATREEVARLYAGQIGRASCRERVRQYV